MKKSNRILAIILPVFCVAIAMLGLCLGLGLKANGGKPAEAAIQTGASTADKSLKGGVIFLDHNQESVFEGGVMQGKSRRYGGAVYVSSGATFTMKGGTITGNQALYGGAIYVEAGGICNIEGGRIEGNSAQHVPGIFLEEGAVLNITGDAVVDNNFYRAYEVELNIFVDGNLTSTDITNLETKLTDFGLPLTDEQCCGYFVDDELKLGVDTNARVFAVAQMNKEMESVRNENDIEVANLYTKTATVNGLDFSLNSSTDTYTAKVNVNNSSLVGTIVAPRMYNGKKVTKLGQNGYSDNTKIEEIIYPNTVTEISSLSYLKGLKKFYVRESLVEGLINNGYNNNAFANCYALESLEISTRHPKYDSRDNCNAVIEKATNTLVFGIKTTVIPESVTKIGNYAFNKNTQLTSINIPSSVKELGLYVFNGCSNLATVSFNEGLTIIGDSSFVGTAIQSITFPNSLISIGFTAFNGVTSLSNVSFGNNLQRIGYSAFQSTSITSINIPNSLKSIDGYAFASTKLSGELIIPENVIEFGPDVFLSCKELIKVTLLQSCDITTSMFSGCSNLSEVVLGEHIKKIGNGAFSSVALTEINIVDNIEYIGAGAFSNCASLLKVTIGENLKDIHHENPFYGCASLESIIVSKKNKTYDTTENINGIVDINTKTLLVGCKNTILQNIISIGNSAFRGSPITSINIPEGVVNISNNAFYSCDYLTTITFPKSLSQIDYRAFYNCSSISRVDLTGSKVSISGYAFQDAIINEIILTDAKLVETSAFYFCGIYNVYLGKNVKINVEMPFSGIKSYENINIYTEYEESEVPASWGDKWFYRSTSTPLPVTFGVTRAEYCQIVHGTTPVVDTPVGCEIDGVSHIDCDICGRIEIVAPAVGHKVEIKANGDGTCLTCHKKLEYLFMNGDEDSNVPGYDVTKEGYEAVGLGWNNMRFLLFFAYDYPITITFDYCLLAQSDCAMHVDIIDSEGNQRNLLKNTSSVPEWTHYSVSLNMGEYMVLMFRAFEDENNILKIRNLNFIKWSQTVDATCMASGSRTGTVLNTGEIITETLPMLGHNVETWTIDQEAVSCTEPGHKHGTCTRCNQTIEADIVIDHDADMSLGLSEFTCKSCNEKLQLAYTGQKYVDENTILVDSNNQFYIWTTTQKKVTITFEYFNDGLASLNIVSGHMPEGSTDPVTIEHITEKNNTITFKTFTITLEPGDALAIQLLDKDGQYDINENAKAYIRNLVVTEVEA